MPAPQREIQTPRGSRALRAGIPLGVQSNDQSAWQKLWRRSQGGSPLEVERWVPCGGGGHPVTTSDRKLDHAGGCGSLLGSMRGHPSGPGSVVARAVWDPRNPLSRPEGQPGPAGGQSCPKRTKLRVPGLGTPLGRTMHRPRSIVRWGSTQRTGFGDRSTCRARRVKGPKSQTRRPWQKRTQLPARSAGLPARSHSPTGGSNNADFDHALCDGPPCYAGSPHLTGLAGRPGTCRDFWVRWGPQGQQCRNGKIPGLQSRFGQPKCTNLIWRQSRDAPDGQCLGATAPRKPSVFAFRGGEEPSSASRQKTMQNCGPKKHSATASSWAPFWGKTPADRCTANVHCMDTVWGLELPSGLRLLCFEALKRRMRFLRERCAKIWAKRKVSFPLEFWW